MAADTVEPAFTPENVLGPFYRFDAPLNEKDSLYKSLRKYAPAAVASTIPTPRDADSEALSFRWDIVLYER